jgi:hypothetical protein
MAMHAFNTIRKYLLSVAALMVLLPYSPASAQTTDADPRDKAQLEQLIAPIALYPDSLLSQVLMASTYPLEVVEAARWVKQNPDVTGQALEEAMQQQNWDPSVKALTAVPQTLQMMNDKLNWTQQLGDALLAQQTDVLNAVQTLRARADATGHLKSNTEQKVTKTAAPAPATRTSPAPAETYVIEPVNADEYFVPIYDPGVVYGAWPYPDYEPFYWYPSGLPIRTALVFTAGVATGAAIWGNIDWRRDRVDIDVDRYNRFNRTNINIANTTWSHNPAHRGAVPYRDKAVEAKFGDPGKAASREDFRDKAQAGQRDLARQKAATTGLAAGQTKGAAAAKQAAGTKAAAAKQAAGTKAAAAAKQAGTKKTAAVKQTAGPKKAAVKQAAGPKKIATQKAAIKPKAAGARPAVKTGAVSHARAQAVRPGVGAQRPAVARGGGRRR